MNMTKIKIFLIGMMMPLLLISLPTFLSADAIKIAVAADTTVMKQTLADYQIETLERKGVVHDVVQEWLKKR